MRPSPRLRTKVGVDSTKGLTLTQRSGLDSITTVYIFYICCANSMLQGSGRLSLVQTTRQGPGAWEANMARSVCHKWQVKQATRPGPIDWERKILEKHQSG